MHCPRLKISDEKVKGYFSIKRLAVNTTDSRCWLSIFTFLIPKRSLSFDFSGPELAMDKVIFVSVTECSRNISDVPYEKTGV